LNLKISKFYFKATASKVCNFLVYESNKRVTLVCVSKNLQSRYLYCNIEWNNRLIGIIGAKVFA